MTWISKILTSWPAGVLLTAAIALAFNLLPEHWIAGLPGTFNLKATVRTSKSKSKSRKVAPTVDWAKLDFAILKDPNSPLTVPVGGGRFFILYVVAVEMDLPSGKVPVATILTVLLVMGIGEAQKAGGALGSELEEAWEQGLEEGFENLEDMELDLEE